MFGSLVYTAFIKNKTKTKNPPVSFYTGYKDIGFQKLSPFFLIVQNKPMIFAHCALENWPLDIGCL